MALRVLTWNLFHGRSRPEAGHALLAQFADRLAAWRWDVALLQEVPPWWPSRLAVATGAERRAALTSRNAALTLRRAIAERGPDLIKSNGGGCNAILARAPIAEHRAVRLRSWPERRVAQLVRLSGGTAVVNYHGSTDTGRAASELERLWTLAREWAPLTPVVLGGDLNLRAPEPPCRRVRHVAARDVDHIFTRGLHAAEPELLDRRVNLGERSVELSDHPPLVVSLSAE